MLGMSVSQMLRQVSSYEISEWIAELKIRMIEQEMSMKKQSQLAKAKQNYGKVKR
jgi:hypothetical protein